MSDSPIPPPPPRPPISLAKVATGFAIAAGVAFGLCSVNVFAGGRLSYYPNLIIPACLLTETVCILGLLIVGVIALIRL